MTGQKAKCNPHNYVCQTVVYDKPTFADSVLIPIPLSTHNVFLVETGKFVFRSPAYCFTFFFEFWVNLGEFLKNGSSNVKRVINEGVKGIEGYRWWRSDWRKLGQRTYCLNFWTISQLVNYFKSYTIVCCVRPLWTLVQVRSHCLYLKRMSVDSYHKHLQEI